MSDTRLVNELRSLVYNFERTKNSKGIVGIEKLMPRWNGLRTLNLTIKF